MESILKKIDQLKEELDSLRSLRDNDTIKQALNLEFLYESNRIEGNTLTLRETQLVINEGLTISGKTMREHLEAINHKEAILFIEDIVSSKMPFSATILLQIHALILHSIDRENAGRYRKVPVQLHERLVTIHPFIDGNGRTARLVMNLILLKNGYPLAIIGGDYENRMAYYDALEKVQIEPDKASFLKLIAEKVCLNIERYIKILK